MITCRGVPLVVGVPLVGGVSLVGGVLFVGDVPLVGGVPLFVKSGCALKKTKLYIHFYTNAVECTITCAKRLTNLFFPVYPQLTYDKVHLWIFVTYFRDDVCK